MTDLEKLIEEKESDLVHFCNVAADDYDSAFGGDEDWRYAFYEDWLDMREMIEDTKQEIASLKRQLAIERWEGEVCLGI